MTRRIRIAAIHGLDAAMTVALAAALTRAGQDVDVLGAPEIPPGPEPLPAIRLCAMPAEQPTGYGPRRARKGKPARW